jgi:quercetin dioxygenase-like cupin family protein
VRPYCLAPGEGERIWMFDALDTVKASADQTEQAFSVVESTDFEGSSAPLHVHLGEDRGFYVLEGKYVFFIGGESFQAEAGSWVFAPRKIPHSWRCDSKKGRVLNVFVPGGFERFYRAVGEADVDPSHLPPASEPDVEHLSAIAAQHGTEIVGPPPDPLPRSQA